MEVRMTPQLNSTATPSRFKIPGSYNLYYDPVQTDRELSENVSDGR